MLKSLTDLHIAAIGFSIQAMIDLVPCDDDRVKELRKLEAILIAKVHEQQHALVPFLYTDGWTHDMLSASDNLMRVARTATMSR